MTIDILEIMAMLPHRYPLLLVDKVLEYELNKSIIGIKNVTFNEPHFTGHFPNKPIMPGVLIIEAMAQLSAILVAKSISSCKEKDVYFMSIDGAKFRKVVQPGDTMYLYAELQQNRGSVWKFSARAEVNKELVAESTFTAMVKDR
jgi:3-hydroxyacyl-[acyl-carrier-protein] dehydratase